MRSPIAPPTSPLVGFVASLIGLVLLVVVVTYAVFEVGLASSVHDIDCRNAAARTSDSIAFLRARIETEQKYADAFAYYSRQYPVRPDGTRISPPLLAAYFEEDLANARALLQKRLRPRLDDCATVTGGTPDPHESL